MCVVFFSGCIRVSAWSENGVNCPDSDYDNGGKVEPALGFCKAGKGVFFYVDHTF